MEDVRTLRRDLARAIQSITQNIATLAAGLVATNAKTQRTSATVVGPFAVGNVDLPVNWPAAWPDTQYGVYLSINSGTAALGALSATLKAGSKTAQDCVITVANTGSGPVGNFGVDVLGVRT